jgi:acetyltransferase-like isoleucine patch superfamily enzyme
MIKISLFSFLKYLWFDFGRFVHKKLRYYELKANRYVDIGDNIQIRAMGNLTVGKEVKIRDGVFLHCGESQENARYGKIDIGDFAYIGPNCVLFGQGEIEIGKNCLIAPGTVITSQQHTFIRRDIPMREQPSERAKIVIEDDVWIGSNSVILPGIRIGQGSVIGAGAVVTKDVPSYSVAIGVPARVIKKRQ